MHLSALCKAKNDAHFCYCKYVQYAAKHGAMINQPDETIRTRSLLGIGAGDREKWEAIAKARDALTKLRAITGKAYSTLAAEAGFAPTTVSRFMRQSENRGEPGKAFVIKTSTLSAIIDKQINDFKTLVGDEDYQACLQTFAEQTRGEKHISEADPRILELTNKYFQMVSIGNQVKRIQDQPVQPMTNKPAASKDVKLLGAVEAGVFREAFELAVEDQLTLPVPGNLYGDNLFGLEVRGDSMDRKFPPGTVLLCEPFNDEHDQLPEDQYVIASRRHSHTDQVEVTVKRLVRTASKDNYVLMPESNNPQHAPLPLEDLGEFSVSVLAIVRAAIQKI